MWAIRRRIQNVRRVRRLAPHSNRPLRRLPNSCASGSSATNSGPLDRPTRRAAARPSAVVAQALAATRPTDFGA